MSPSRTTGVHRLEERDTQLEHLAGLLARARAGEGATVLVHGPSGSGKTALLQAFRQRCQDTDWHDGQCDPMDAPSPLGPLLEVVGSLDTAGAPGQVNLSPAPGQVNLSPAPAASQWLYAHLAALPPGTVVAIEDVHWADDATRDALRFVVRRSHRLPCLLLLTYSETGLPHDHSLRRLLGDLATAHGVERVGLPPLSVEAVTRLAAGQGLDAEELHRTAAGNAFYVTEIIAAGGPEVPETVRASVDGQLARLDPAWRRLIDVVAVAGPLVEPGLLGALVPAWRTGLAHCCEAGLVHEQATGVGFRHEIVRAVVLGQLTRADTRRLHQDVLDALVQGAAETVEPARLAHHADGAGDAVAVLLHAPAAAARAMSAGAFGDALTQFDRAQRHADDAPAQVRAALAAGHATAAFLCGRMDEALSSGELAARLHEEMGDPVLLAADHVRLADIHSVCGRLAPARASSQKSIRLLAPRGPTADLVQALATGAGVEANAGSPADAVRLGEQAVALAAQLGAPHLALTARCFIATAHAQTSADHDVAPLEQLWDETVHSDPVVAGRAAVVLAWSLVEQRRLPEARRAVERGLRHCRDHSLPAFADTIEGLAARVHLHEGDLAAARDGAHRLLARTWMPRITRSWALLVAVQAAARQGAADTAALAAELDDLFAGDDPEYVWVAAALAEDAWAAGDDVRLAEVVDRCRDLSPGSAPWTRAELARWARLGGLDLDPTGTSSGPSAAATTTRVASAATTGAGPGPRPTSGTVTVVGRGDIPASPGPFALEEAGDLGAAALAWERLGCPYDAALARAGGGTEDVRRALHSLRDLGATATARRVRELAIARGVPLSARGPRVARDNPFALTDRQLEVLHLVAEGLTNREIGQRLWISPVTVGHHVEAVLAKVGVAHRRDAASALRRLTSG